MATGITNDYYLPANNPNFKVTDKKDNGALGKDAFLQILITQLQNQDPTSPMDDKEFIAQMAQFSSLEQMQNMTKAMEKLLASQEQTQLMNYSTFVGKEVKWHELTDKLDTDGKPLYNDGTGTIQELKFVDGEAVFVLADGKKITPGNISSILSGGTNTGAGTSTSISENPLVEASKLIGQTIHYKNAENQLVEAIIDSITTNNGEINYILNNQDRLTKDRFTTATQNTQTTTEEDSSKTEVTAE